VDCAREEKGATGACKELGEAKSTRSRGPSGFKRAERGFWSCFLGEDDGLVVVGGYGGRGGTFLQLTNGARWAQSCFNQMTKRSGEGRSSYVEKGGLVNEDKGSSGARLSGW